MSLERPRLPPRERTFLELFPWRNILRAAMLLLLILAIVAMKRSTGPLLARLGQMWGSPGPSNASPTRGPFETASDPPVRRIRLGPGLSPVRVDVGSDPSPGSR